jgi:hypothetical protein
MHVTVRWDVPSCDLVQISQDDRNRWPKHIVGYAVYNAINLHICMHFLFAILMKNHQRMAHESYKIETKNFTEFLSFQIQRESNS